MKIPHFETDINDEYHFKEIDTYMEEFWKTHIIMLSRKHREKTCKIGEEFVVRLCVYDILPVSVIDIRQQDAVFLRGVR